MLILLCCSGKGTGAAPAVPREEPAGAARKRAADSGDGTGPGAIVAGGAGRVAAVAERCGTGAACCETVPGATWEVVDAALAGGTTAPTSTVIPAGTGLAMGSGTNRIRARCRTSDDASSMIIGLLSGLDSPG